MQVRESCTKLYPNLTAKPRPSIRTHAVQPTALTQNRLHFLPRADKSFGNSVATVRPAARRRRYRSRIDLNAADTILPETPARVPIMAIVLRPNARLEGNRGTEPQPRRTQRSEEEWEFDLVEFAVVEEAEGVGFEVDFRRFLVDALACLKDWQNLSFFESVRGPLRTNGCILCQDETVDKLA